MTAYPSETHVIGGVDTHKDLHVAAVVDHRDRVLGTESFPTTRHGYRLMLAWMRSFGDLRRVGVECSGSYGAGLLRYLQAAGVDVLEVTAPDKHDRRRRGKNDDYDAESAAHAAFAKRHTVTPRSRDGMVESRKPAVRAVCSDCVNGGKALPYGMRFICFTHRDLCRRRDWPSSALDGRGQDPDRRGEPARLSAGLGNRAAVWDFAVAAVDLAARVSQRDAWRADQHAGGWRGFRAAGYGKCPA